MEHGQPSYESILRITFSAHSPASVPTNQLSSRQLASQPSPRAATIMRRLNNVRGGKFGIEAMLVESGVCHNKATSDPLPTYGMNASPPPNLNVGILTDPWQRILRLFSLAQRTQYRLSSTLRLGSGGLMLYEDRLAEWLYFRKHWYHASLHKFTRTLWWWKFRQSDLESV